MPGSLSYGNQPRCWHLPKLPHHLYSLKWLLQRFRLCRVCQVKFQVVNHPSEHSFLSHYLYFHSRSPRSGSPNLPPTTVPFSHPPAVYPFISLSSYFQQFAVLNQFREDFDYSDTVIPNPGIKQSKWKLYGVLPMSTSEVISVVVAAQSADRWPTRWREGGEGEGGTMTQLFCPWDVTHC